MRSRPCFGASSVKRQGKFARPIVGTAMAVSAVIAIAGCSSKIDNSPQAPFSPASNVTLTAAQRQNIRLYTVKPAKFRRTIEATGVVDFDNDQATSVLAPFSGPVSRLLVSPGDKVKEGAPLAVVDSPDFAAAISAYQKALATAQTDRRLADLQNLLSRDERASGIERLASGQYEQRRL